jgi:Zn-dependent protease
MAVFFGLFFVSANFDFLPLWGRLAVWTGWLFVSVLVHEFGHIGMGRCCDREGYIVLFVFGGLAVWQRPAARRWQRIAIFLAGPGAGFLFFGLVCLARDYGLPRIPLAVFAQNPTLREAVVTSLLMLWLMNLVLNLLNLIPLWPLDGGQVLGEIFSWIFPERGLRLAVGFSALLAGSVAVYSLFVWKNPDWPFVSRLHPMVTGVFLGFMALNNLMLYLQLRQASRQA